MGIRLNSLGFMDVEFGPKQPVVYRIASPGEFFAYGVVPYRQNYLTVLEDHLNAIGTVAMLNMGIAGIDPKDYFDLLVRERLSQEPDAVLVAFFIGNDITQGAGQAKERNDLARGYSYLWGALRYPIWIRPFVEPPGNESAG